MNELQSRLFALRDEPYQAFQARLLPNLSPDRIIGVRTPALRALAKEMAKRPDAGLFLGALPHEYYEENALHGFMIETIRDYDRAVEELERFLPYVDNWAVCDMTSPKVFARHTDRLKGRIDVWLSSPLEYTVRYGIGMLMRYYLEDGLFDGSILEQVARVAHEAYYVRMMAAWFFATALAKQYDAALPYIEEGRLPPWTHNKAIQKAVESARVDRAHKEYLKTLRR